MSNGRKTVLITGCTPGGIGSALALEFHRKGLHVIATARRPEVLNDLAEQGLSIAQLDVTSQESIDACKAEVYKLTDGRLDILVNNAGRSHTIPALDAEVDDDVRKTYDTNVFGPMRMVRSFIHMLIAARGLVLNISSTSTQVPYLFGAIYSSTKGALDVWSRALRLELRPFGVRVMVAQTGTVRSNFASGPERSLPEDSLYAPVRDIFEWRLTFSQKNGTVRAEDYAKRVVAQALRGEGWLNGFVGGTPYWFWYGGLSTIVWIASLLPRRTMEVIMSLYWNMGKMGRRIAAAKKNA